MSDDNLAPESEAEQAGADQKPRFASLKARLPSPFGGGGSVGYGIDQPRTIVILTVAGLIAMGTGVLVNHFLSSADGRYADISLSAGLGVGALLLLVSGALYWSSRVGKIRQIRRLVRAVPWGGNEVVLDVGCGRGPFTVAAAARLTSGDVLSLDLWKAKDVSGNDPRSVVSNAEAGQVGDRVTPVKGDIRVLPFADESFDVIVSAMALASLRRRTEINYVVSEMTRVLKKGGRIAVLDPGQARDFSILLRDAGMSDITVSLLRLGLFPPAQTVVARKPFVESLGAPSSVIQNAAAEE